MLIGVNPHEKSEMPKVRWIGHKASDPKTTCTVEAVSWFEARELARAKLGADEDEAVEVRIELTP